MWNYQPALPLFNPSGSSYFFFELFNYFQFIVYLLKESLLFVSHSFSLMMLKFSLLVRSVVVFVFQLRSIFTIWKTTTFNNQLTTFGSHFYLFALFLPQILFFKLFLSLSDIP